MLKELGGDQVQILAVVQEQHAERARLYKQWREFDMVILQDSICELELVAVPYIIPLDESLRVVAHRADEKFFESWLSKPATELAEPVSARETEFSEVDNQLKFHEGEMDLGSVISGYEKMLADHDSDARLHFRLGVAYRMRYDRDQSPGDFELAAKHWSRALEINPNQYIFRRRIEQYGPRLNKPYPFYDWVETAIAEVKERGEEPAAQNVELTGSEIAGRARKFESVEQAGPVDADRRVNLDSEKLVNIQPVIVPSKLKPGQAGRVHVVLDTNDIAKWNNESAPLTIWIESTDGVVLSQNNLVYKLQDESDQSVTSSELRTLEFEVKLDKGSTAESLKCFALYNVCKEDGVCMYLRQEFEIELN